MASELYMLTYCCYFATLNCQITVWVSGTKEISACLITVRKRVENAPKFMKAY